MIRAFYGDDTYRSREAVRQARAEAEERAGVPAVALHDEGVTPAVLQAALEGQSLFTKSLSPVVAEQLTTFTGAAAERVAAILAAVPRGRTLLVWEDGVPSPQGIVWRALQKHAEDVQVFAPLEPEPLRSWVRQAARARGRAFEDEALERLCQTTGPDLWRLSTELDKLELVPGEVPVTAAHVGAVVTGRAAADAFATVRAIAAGDAAAAYRLLAGYLRAGEEPRRLFFLVAREFQLLSAVRRRLDAGGRVHVWDLVRELRLPRVAVEALLAVARQTSAAQIRSLCDRCVVAYYHLNTGQATAEEVLESLLLQRAGVTAPA